MTALPGLLRTVIWATRGRTWGFRFLLDGGLQDPLRTYEEAFSPIGDQRSVHYRLADGVAVRFPDPLGRKDRSGRPIPHEFVVSGPLADRIATIEDVLMVLWPEVAEAYAQVWEREKPPRTSDLGFEPRHGQGHPR